MIKDKDGLKEVVLVLHDIRSVVNVGAIFRTAEAFGVGEVILSGYTPGPLDRFGRLRGDFSKASLGAEESLIWRRFDSAEDVIGHLSSGGHKLLALEQTSESIDMRKFKSKDLPYKKLALVVGNELLGVEESFLNKAEAVLEIPQFGKKESLNVASATAIALYALLAQ